MKGKELARQNLLRLEWQSSRTKRATAQPPWRKIHSFITSAILSESHLWVTRKNGEQFNKEDEKSPPGLWVSTWWAHSGVTHQTWVAQSGGGRTVVRDALQLPPQNPRRCSEVFRYALSPPPASHSAFLFWQPALHPHQRASRSCCRGNRIQIWREGQVYLRLWWITMQQQRGGLHLKKKTNRVVPVSSAPV